MGLILGGAIGNVIDRASGGIGMTGRVTDFIDFRIWPVFNVADSGIVVGAVLLALSSLHREEKEAS
jgi:signal peptidase II